MTVVMDSGACPGPDPAFAGMTELLVSCSFAKILKRLKAQGVDLKRLKREY
jgi:hypothetical protein